MTARSKALRRLNKLGAGGLECRKRSYVFIERSKLIKESPMLEKYKLFVPKAWGNMDERSGYIGGSFSEILVVNMDLMTEKSASLRRK